jgi:hypothetical protein
MKPISMCFAATASLLAASQPAAADCQCRAEGVVATHGQTLCIPTPNGMRLARCSKVSNVSSWTFLDGPCPVAALDSALRPADPPRLPQSQRLTR